MGNYFKNYKRSTVTACINLLPLFVTLNLCKDVHGAHQHPHTDENAVHTLLREGYASAGWARGPGCVLKIPGKHLRSSSCP